MHADVKDPRVSAAVAVSAFVRADALLV